MSMRRWESCTGAILISLCVLAGCESYTQEQQDRDVLWNFRRLITETWNTNIAGTTTTSPDFTLTGTGCGTLRVTGQIQADARTHSLTYTFDKYCAEIGYAGNLPLHDMTGEIRVSGVVDGDMTFKTDNLLASGSLMTTGHDPVPLEGALALDCTFNQDGGSGSVNGRPRVTWKYRKEGGGDSCQAAATCCTTSGGIQVIMVTCATGTCPSGTTFTGHDATFNVDQCLCNC